ncbi:hypothetical protein ECG_06765 [Echinococcus granulosus]|uniref:Uncharacterized protein n=1 Tax=Echinococcus granulosus TaxID=6210 RepID=U6JBM4_ECHGR|nr:hypothetical protein EGR_02413 [Echinococcus granulosus]EUB62617.1 hypothetical protein EGR_02413 [Echinococcus granulosus]KAH9280647.1 hypothetical protein ECG_06765 [Echinococcus granulosus]CDS19144.1 hypothetical protein EgrG_000442900 [Echinococcus granulosus]
MNSALEKAVVCNPAQNSFLKIDKTFCNNYIDPDSLDKEDPTKSSPLALLIETCDRVRKNLEQTKFSTILCDLVNDMAAPPSLVGQKRHADALLRHPPVKLRRPSFHPPSPPVPPLHPFFLPPPQTEPINLSSKLVEVATTFAPFPTPPPSLSPTPSPLSLTPMTSLLTQLLFFSGLLPHLLKLGPLFSPPCQQYTLRSLFTPPSQTQAAFLP